jgi:hypothetical protein
VIEITVIEANRPGTCKLVKGVYDVAEFKRTMTRAVLSVSAGGDACALRVFADGLPCASGCLDSKIQGLHALTHPPPPLPAVPTQLHSHPTEAERHLGQPEVMTPPQVCDAGSNHSSATGTPQRTNWAQGCRRWLWVLLRLHVCGVPLF